MKKLFVLLIIILSILALSSCFAQNTDSLPAPQLNLSEDGSHIYWDEVRHAVYYEVKYGDNTVIVRDKTEYYFETGGDDKTVLVKAKGDGIIYSDSEAVSLTGDFRAMLNEPEFDCALEVGNLVITWDKVANAVSYIIDINETEFETSQTEFTYALLQEGTYNIGITAVAPSSGFFIDSRRAAAKIVYTLPVPAALNKDETDKKNFDKINTNDISFMIDIKDDKFVSLTGNGIADANFTFNGSKLTIKNAFLKTLDIGDNIFDFETELTVIKLTVSVADSRVPALALEGINYNIHLDDYDLEIGLILNNWTLDGVYLNEALLTLNTNYTYTEGNIVFESDYLKDFDTGVYQVKMDFIKGEDGHSLIFILNIIDTQEPYSEQTIRTFDKNNVQDIEFNLVMNSAMVHTVAGPINTGDWSYSQATDTLTLKGGYLKGLDCGTYDYVVHTTENAFAVSVNVVNSNVNCYNVRIDFDEANGDIMLRWDYDGQAVDFVYMVKNQMYGPVLTKEVNIKSLVSRMTNFNFRVKPNDTISEFSPLQVWQSDTGASSYLSDFYTYMGETYDHYMGSQEEFNHFIEYASFNRIETDEVYIAFDYGISIQEELEEALYALEINQVSSYGYTIYPSKVLEVTLHYAANESPELSTNYDETIQHQLYPSHIEELKGATPRPAGYDLFEINTITATQTVKSSDQLFLTVEAGLKPLPEANSDALRIYNAAKTVLREIITDDMDDIDKLHAIYDWIIHNVVYDYEMLSIYNDEEHPDHASMNNFKCFYLEGVFDEGLAVCDGIAKAFVLLARIEGIEAIKVSGITDNNHAWNKVKLGGKWYSVDCTYGNIFDNNNKYEFMLHGYFLVSDIELTESHRETGPYYAAVESYDYYANAPEGDLYIENQAEFNALVSAVWNTKNCLEFVNISSKTIQQLMNNIKIFGHYYPPINNVSLIIKD